MVDKEESCVVFVSNKTYLNKFEMTLKQLRENGEYDGKILLVIGDDLFDNQDEISKKYSVQIKYFPNIEFSKVFMNCFNTLERGNLPHFQNKIFQYHKFYLFHNYFKDNFKKIIYIDCGMHINYPAEKIFNLEVTNKLLGDYDFRVHPKRFHKPLENQFATNYTDALTELKKTHDLSKLYPQTTFLMYDTNIIQDDTFSELLNISEQYPISLTNDQAIIALYYTQIKPFWKQIPIGDETMYYYSYKFTDKKKPTIMSKWNR
jgi:hypothetical protein